MLMASVRAALVGADIGAGAVLPFRGAGAGAGVGAGRFTSMSEEQNPTPGTAEAQAESKAEVVDKEDDVEEDEEDEEVGDDSCPICLCEFEHGDDMAQLPCHASHLFHYDCILMWFQQATSCPLCAGDLAAGAVADATAAPPNPAGLHAFGLPLLDEHGAFPGQVVDMAN